MNTLNFTKKIVFLAVVLVAVVAFFYMRGLFSNKQVVREASDQIKIISTNPLVIENQVFLPTQNIEVTFNKPLVNEPETRVLFEPVVDFRKELSLDRKTIKIILNKPLQLGQGYTLFIKAGTKFEGGKDMENDQIFHFTTINYRGV